MRLEELKSVLEKYGYRLLDYTRFKNSDRLKIMTSENIVLTLSLKKHLEEVPTRSLLSWILTKEELQREFGANPLIDPSTLDPYLTAGGSDGKRR
ncbi:MAG: hypothetical protein QXT64_07735 [Desulfurococcaceae archaeon]